MNVGAWVAFGLGVAMIVAAFVHVLWPFRPRCAFCRAKFVRPSRWVDTCDACSSTLGKIDQKAAARAGDGKFSFTCAEPVDPTREFTLGFGPIGLVEDVLAPGTFRPNGPPVGTVLRQADDGKWEPLVEDACDPVCQVCGRQINRIDLQWKSYPCGHDAHHMRPRGGR